MSRNDLETMAEIEIAAHAARAYRCIACGKCTGVCPVAAHDDRFSPRKIVEEALSGSTDAILRDPRLWACLSCGACRDRCHLDVDFPQLVRDLRILARRTGIDANYAHGGGAQSLMRMMSKPEIKQRRTAWLTPDLRVSLRSDVLFFVGCLPYFDPLFRYTGAKSLNIARNTVSVLNQLGVEPLVLDSERCCGYDLLWSGDLDGFTALAKHNLATIKQSGAKQVITACPECLVTLSADYAKYVGNLGIEVLHITQWLANEVATKGVTLGKLDQEVTYQDPCRLTRFAGVYDEPRVVLSAIEGLKLVEMEHSKTRGVCCGTQAWMNCGAVSKAIQVSRLREAAATGAQKLVTACPKCQIHLRCAQVGSQTDQADPLEIQDIVSLVATALAARK